MEKKESPKLDLDKDDSAYQQAFIEKLDETGIFSQFSLNKEVMPQTKLKWDSIVALLVEKNVELRDGEIVKLVLGQVGRPDNLDGEEPYEISFYDENLIKQSAELLDQENTIDPVFIAIGVKRNELLELNTNYNQSSSTYKTVDISKNLKQENSFSVTDISDFNIQQILKKVAKIINESLSADFKNNFEPGNLVTVTADFVEEKDDSFKIKICAGYIGIILNPDKDEIIDENTKRVLNIKNYLKEDLEDDEILVYFGELHLWDFFDLSKNNYNNIASFEKNNCYILNKAFLLPLCFKKHLSS